MPFLHFCLFAFLSFLLFIFCLFVFLSFCHSCHGHHGCHGYIYYHTNLCSNLTMLKFYQKFYLFTRGQPVQAKCKSDLTRPPGQNSGQAANLANLANPPESESTFQSSSFQVPDLMTRCFTVQYLGSLWTKRGFFCYNFVFVHTNKWKT